MGVQIAVIVLGVLAAVARKPLATGNLFLRSSLGRERDLDDVDARFTEWAFALVGLGLASAALYFLVT
jgi:hypothetical protein